MRNLFNFRSGKSSPRFAKAPAGAKDARAYAIGDVHGRLDLLTDLLAKIEADNAGRPPAKTWLVMLGDLIDRGPESRGVIDLFLKRPPNFGRLVLLMGNHEEMMLRGLSGEPEVIPNWLKYGGMECAESYGVPTERIAGHNPQFMEAEIKHAVPQEHLDFLRSFHDSFRFGDYLFVHAGIRPGIPLEEQDHKDLRWIRDDFLECREEHGMVVVHGHTVVEAPDDRGNRIAIDIGAYHTGQLAAIGIEGQERWFLSSQGEPAERDSRWSRG